MGKVRNLPLSTTHYAILRTPEKTALNGFRRYLRSLKTPYRTHQGNKSVWCREIIYQFTAADRCWIISPHGRGNAEISFTDYADLIRKAENIMVGLAGVKSAQRMGKQRPQPSPESSRMARQAADYEKAKERERQEADNMTRMWGDAWAYRAHLRQVAPHLFPRS